MKRAPRDSRPEDIERPGRGRGFYLSVLLHTALIVVCLVGLDWTVHEIAPALPGDGQVMNVTSVDPNAVAQEVEKLKAAEQAKQREADRKVKEAEQQRKKEEEALEKLKTEKENLKREKEAENKRLEEEKQRLQQEKEKAAQEKQKVEQEKQKALAEKKKLDEEQKKVTEKKKAEDKKKAAAEEAKKKDADARKKADDAKKQAAKDAEAKRKASEKALQDELAAEEAAMAATAQGRKDASELARYTAAIMRQVADNFVAPDINSGLKCTLLVRMIPGGDVVDARVVKSSGNATFDRQAELAVRKASPLSVPEDPRLFEQMRQIQFEFDPSEVSP